MRQLSVAQLVRIRQDYARWRTTPAPCGISHEDPFNPCLPQEEEGRMSCLTCGERQQLQLAPTAATNQPRGCCCQRDPCTWPDCPYGQDDDD